MGGYIIKGIIQNSAIFIDQELGRVSLRQGVFSYSLIRERVGEIRYFNNRLQIQLFSAKIHNYPQKKKSLKIEVFYFLKFHRLKRSKFTTLN